MSLRGLINEQDAEKLMNEDYNDDDSQIHDNRRFDSCAFVSKAIKSKICTINENILQLHHSFGYDCCSKMFNICAADEHTVVYVAGSYITMFDIDNRSLSFRKSAGNGGIGHITKNPVFSHLAVGENCSDPLIVVYDWPSFEIVSVLKGSAERKNNWLTYNQSGDYLCSQGGEPDHTLTIWDWKKSEIVLRTKSHTHNVYTCRFSTFVPDHLVTAGSGHVKFWKMATTFTGLKFQGQLGRFGKTEVSDIIGIFSMPDEKVISGCEWGNILVWDEELIAVEVMRKGRKPCHLAPVIMFLYSELDAELTSVSMDGTIKFWYYHTVNIADPPEDNRVLEMEPSFTISIQDSVGVARIMGMCKINADPNSHDYFIQDGNGGIWLADIEVAANAKPLRRLAKFHGDVITSLQASPIGHFVATTSLDGWLHVYDVIGKKLMFTHDFKVPVTSLLWLPLKIVNSGNVFAIGFQTGILKIVAVPLKEIVEENLLKSIIEIQSSKPHTGNIGQMTVNFGGDILVCGSDDCSVFVYKVETEPVKLSPIGMYSLPGKVTFIHWKTSEKQTALISCASGQIVEVNFPTSRPAYTKESFLLKLDSRVVETTTAGVVSHKINKKNEKLKTTLGEYPGIDEKSYLDGNDEPSKMFISPTPNPVLFAVYTPSEETFWVSIDGEDDTGFLYEYDFNTSGPINVTQIPNKKNETLTAIEMFGIDSLTILMGFSDGKIRITNVKLDNITDLSDYIEYSIHDNQSGRVKTLCFSQDGCMLFTYGNDGNIFSFMFQLDGIPTDIPISDLPESPKFVEETIIHNKEDLKLSLEEKKINKGKRKALNMANKEKDKINCLLYGLKEKFKQVVISNKSLPEQLQFPHNYFQFDERINSSLIEEAQSKMDNLHLKLAFDYEKSLLGLKKVKNYFTDKILTSKFEVKAILKDASVKTIYHEQCHNIFSSLVEEFVFKKHPKQCLDEICDPISVRRRRKSTVLEKKTDSQIHKVTESEIFLRNVREIYQTLPKKIQSAVDKFAARIDFENKEILQIKSMHNEKPDNTNIEEEAVLNEAWETIGDFNLKTAPDFKPSDDQTVTMEDKFEQYMRIKKEVFDLKSKFNQKVFDLRQRKIRLIHVYKQFKFDVCKIQNELNDPETTTPSDFPEVLLDESTDPNLIDSFVPIHHLDPMYLVLNPEKSNLYTEMSINEFHEIFTDLEITMQLMRKDRLKYKHQCLHESMLTKINMFDDYLFFLEASRKDVKLRITLLDLFSIKLEEELLILNEFDLLENEYSHNVYLQTGKQNDKVNQILTIREEIKRYNKIIENKLNRLVDIQHTFDMEVRNNDFAKHLRRIFRKKLKTPKIKSDDDDESLSSSSSDDTDDSDSESVQNESGEWLMGRIAVFDENVLPEGCDPKLFALTFELRSLRHEIEQSVENTRRKLEVSNKTMSSAHAEFDTSENELKHNLDELDAYRIKKQSKLNEVETTILLNKSQMTKANFFGNSILVYGNIMQVLTNRVAELKKEREDIKDIYKDEKLLAKQLRTEITAMEHVLKKYKVAIKDEMIKKFSMETDWSFLDDMEMAIINYMIIQAKSNAEETKERFVKEIKSLESQIRAHQDILTDLLGAQTVKTITLKAVREGIQQTQLSLSTQPKSHKKVEDLSVDNAYVSDMAALKEVYGTLSKRKRDICNEINALKYKGKMFPPIAAARQPSPSQQAERVGGDSFDGGEYLTATAVQEDTEESWTIDEDQSYNIEFNVEPKIVSASSKQSSRLTKQSLRYDSFDEVSYGEDDRWRTYYDGDGGVKGVFGETAETRNDRVSSSSDGSESIGGNLFPGIELKDRVERNGTTAVQEELDDDNDSR